MESPQFSNPYENISSDDKNEEKDDKISSKKAQNVYFPRNPEKLKDEKHKKLESDKLPTNEKRPEVFARKPFADNIIADKEKPTDTFEQDNLDNLSKEELKDVTQQLLQNRSQEIADEIANPASGEVANFEAMAAASFIDNLSESVAQGDYISDALLQEISNQTIDEFDIDLSYDEMQALESLLENELNSDITNIENSSEASPVDDQVDSNNEVPDGSGVNDGIEDESNAEVALTGDEFSVSAQTSNVNNVPHPNILPGAPLRGNINGYGSNLPPPTPGLNGNNSHAWSPNAPNFGGSGGQNFGPPPPAGPRFNNYNSGPVNFNLHNFASTSVFTTKRLLESRRRHHRGRDLLLGGIVGYLIGRRRGRIKTENRLIPVQEKLEKQVTKLDGRIFAQEAKIRTLTAEKLSHEKEDVRRQLAEKIKAKHQNKTERVNTQAKVKKITIPENIVRFASAAALESGLSNDGMFMDIAEEANLQSNVRLGSTVENKTTQAANGISRLTHMDVMSMPADSLLKMASTVEIGGRSIKRIFEQGLISKDELREILAEQTINKSRAEQLLSQKIAKETPDVGSREILSDSSEDPINDLTKIGSELRRESRVVPTVYLETDKDADITSIANEIISNHTSNEHNHNSHNYVWLLAGIISGLVIVLAIFSL